jgi:hypothetical protein
MITKYILTKRVQRAVTVAAATLALQIVVYAACNKAGSNVSCYAGNLTDGCDAKSPNCGTDLYHGGVSGLGTRTVVTAVVYGVDPPGSGRTGTKENGKCQWQCTITSDCEHQSPQVDMDGSANIIPDPDATACP